jgi:hypothetical protein
VISACADRRRPRRAFGTSQGDGGSTRRKRLRRQVDCDVPLVAVDHARLRLAPVPHVGVPDRDAAVVRDSAADARRTIVGIRLDVLLDDLSEQLECLSERHVVVLLEGRVDPCTQSVRVGEQSVERLALLLSVGPVDVAASPMTLAGPTTSRRAAARTSAEGRPQRRAAQSTTTDKACPTRLKVSSTRPAPQRGAESSATRSCFAPKSAEFAASSTVRWTSRRSRSWAIRRRRNSTSTP